MDFYTGLYSLTFFHTGPYLQSFTGYLGLTLVFMESSALQETLISSFQEFSASINKMFIHVKLSFYGTFHDTFLIFPNFPRS